MKKMKFGGVHYVDRAARARSEVSANLLRSDHSHQSILCVLWWTWKWVHVNTTTNN